MGVRIEKSYTVVIPTKNGLKRGIVELYDSLMAQSLPPKRVIVINNESEDATAGYMREAGCEVLDFLDKDFSPANIRNFILPYLEDDELVFFTCDDVV